MRLLDDDEPLLLIASGFFFAGNAFLLCGNMDQASLKTVALLALSIIVAVPFYEPTLGEIFYYIITSLLWMWTLYSICKKDSALNQTYNRELDNFPHWVLCLCPALAVTFSIYLLLHNGDGFAGCRENFKEQVRPCMDHLLWLLSYVLAAFAFVPQAHINIKIWRTGEKLKFKVRVFMMCMFICYSLQCAHWLWQLGKIAWDYFANEVYAVAILSNAMTLTVIASPWIYRSTCMRCCDTIQKPGNEGLGDMTMVPNTGEVNDVVGEEEENKRKSWFSFKAKETASVESLDEVSADLESPSLSIKTDWEKSSALATSPSTFMAPSNDNAANYDATNVDSGAFANGNAVNYSQPAPSTYDNRPDWLQ